MFSSTDVLKALPVAVYATDADGRITFFNEAAAEFWGRRPVLNEEFWCGTYKLYWPDGRPMPHEECPMGVALREGRELRGVEAIAERPDGSRAPFTPYPTLLRDSEGRITGALNLLVDITERKGAEIEGARLAAIVASSDDAIVSKRLDGIIETWNASAERIFGYSPEEVIGQSVLLIIPDELRHEEAVIIGKIKAGERVEHFDTVRLTKDGRRIDVSLTVSPVRDTTGRIIGASKIARDITQQKESERLQSLLFNELNHRVKNTLATIQSLAAQSLRRAPNPADFVASFNGRVQALGRAHDLLVSTNMRGADLHNVIREQVFLGNTSDGLRVACAGPRVSLDSRTTVQLGLVLHELATNARKYGAIAAPSGQIAIRWEVEVEDDRQLLKLAWTERGVPQIKAPSKSGFGSILIERSVQSSGGTVSQIFGPDGLIYHISLPLGSDATSEPRNQEDVRQFEDPCEGSGHKLRGKRILLIEDEPLIAMEVEALLGACGCDVIGPAGTLAEAKRLIGSGTFDAAVVDANLAGATVEDIAAALADKNVPFAFASGYGRSALPQGYPDAPYLAKPFTPAALFGALESLFRRDDASVVVPLHPTRRR